MVCLCVQDTVLWAVTGLVCRPPLPSAAGGSAGSLELQRGATCHCALHTGQPAGQGGCYSSHQLGWEVTPLSPRRNIPDTGVGSQSRVQVLFNSLGCLALIAQVSLIKLVRDLLSPPCWDILSISHCP